ncbi:hypothetical protein F383_25926 [Gossypium arboreum]|uniref:Uncharacterized protein n=1 Tax=Gossypium arboreum TaxID=29729 RepID=A0A0B0NZT7_GOSAR|nr:hypothetical protein F383_25926 [Gossypium arboreum]
METFQLQPITDLFSTNV